MNLMIRMPGAEEGMTTLIVLLFNTRDLAAFLSTKWRKMLFDPSAAASTGHKTHT